jgi:hypothetical protein
MSNVDSENELYYNNYFALFRTDGWKQLVDELYTNAGAIDSVESTKSADDLHFRKGQLNVLRHLINFENAIHQGFDEFNQEQDQEND